MGKLQATRTVRSVAALSLTSQIWPLELSQAVDGSGCSSLLLLLLNHLLQTWKLMDVAQVTSIRACGGLWWPNATIDHHRPEVCCWIITVAAFPGFPWCFSNGVLQFL